MRVHGVVTSTAGDKGEVSEVMTLLVSGSEVTVLILSGDIGLEGEVVMVRVC